MSYRSRNDARCRRAAATVPVALGLTGLVLGACGSTTPTAGSAAGATPTTAAVASATGGCSSAAPGGKLSASCDTHTPSMPLTGAGANSIQPFFARVFYAFNQADHGVSVNYSPVGSSVGVTDIQQNTVQFGDSEIPMSAPATGSGGPILQLPVDLGGVALSYDLPGVKSGLKLDGAAIAGIYLGTITKWNDPAIAALNPGVNLPALAITPVHRADSSGPGYDLDQYLIDTGGSTWTDKCGATPSTHWPAACGGSGGVGQQLNTGVANYIQQTQGAIGYVEYGYALQANFTNVAVKNHGGAFVAPSQQSIADAGSNASNLSASNFNIVNGPGAETYPLANFSWTLVYQKQSNTNLAIVLGKLFDWVTSTGQQQARALGYSPLPANVAALAHSTLLQLQTSSGQAVFSG